MQRQQFKSSADSALEQTDHVEESLSIRSIRPTTPSRRSIVTTPVFDTERTDYAVTPKPLTRPVTPDIPLSPPADLKDKEPGIFWKVFGGRRGRVAGERSSGLSSVVGLYATQVTMLAAAILGKHTLQPY